MTVTKRRYLLLITTGILLNVALIGDDSSFCCFVQGQTTPTHSISETESSGQITLSRSRGKNGEDLTPTYGTHSTSRASHTMQTISPLNTRSSSLSDETASLVSTNTARKDSATHLASPSGSGSRHTKSVTKRTTTRSQGSLSPSLSTSNSSTQPSPTVTETITPADTRTDTFPLTSTQTFTGTSSDTITPAPTNTETYTETISPAPTNSPSRSLSKVITPTPGLTDTGWTFTGSETAPTLTFSATEETETYSDLTETLSFSGTKSDSVGATEVVLKPNIVHDSWLTGANGKREEVPATAAERRSFDLQTANEEQVSADKRFTVVQFIAQFNIFNVPNLATYAQNPIIKERELSQLFHCVTAKVISQQRDEDTTAFWSEFWREDRLHVPEPHIFEIRVPNNIGHGKFNLRGDMTVEFEFSGTCFGIRVIPFGVNATLTFVHDRVEHAQVPESALQVAEHAGFIGSAVAALASTSGAAAFSAPRMLGFLEIQTCNFYYGEPLPWFQHPLHFSIGDDSKTRYYLGMALGHFLLCSFFTLVHFALAHLMAPRRAPNFQSKAANVFFPGLSLLVFTLLLVDGTRGSVIVLIHGSNSGEKALAGFCLVFWVSFIVLLILRTTKLFHSEYELLPKLGYAREAYQEAIEEAWESVKEEKTAKQLLKQLDRQSKRSSNLSRRRNGGGSNVTPGKYSPSPAGNRRISLRSRHSVDENQLFTDDQGDLSSEEEIFLTGSSQPRSALRRNDGRRGRFSTAAVRGRRSGSRSSLKILEEEGYESRDVVERRTVGARSKYSNGSEDEDVDEEEDEEFTGSFDDDYKYVNSDGETEEQIVERMTEPERRALVEVERENWMTLVFSGPGKWRDPKVNPSRAALKSAATFTVDFDPWASPQSKGVKGGSSKGRHTPERLSYSERVQRESVKGQTKMFLSLFWIYRPGRQWFVVIEALTCFASSIILAVRPDDFHCQYVFLGLALVYLAYLIALLVLRPFTALFQGILFFIIGLWQFVAAFLLFVDGVVLPASSDSQRIRAAAAWIIIILIFLVVLKSLVDSVVLFVEYGCGEKVRTTKVSKLALKRIEEDEARTETEMREKIRKEGTKSRREGQSDQELSEVLTADNSSPLAQPLLETPQGVLQVPSPQSSVKQQEIEGKNSSVGVDLGPIPDTTTSYEDGGGSVLGGLVPPNTQSPNRNSMAFLQAIEELKKMPPRRVNRVLTHHQDDGGESTDEEELLARIERKKQKKKAAVSPTARLSFSPTRIGDRPPPTATTNSNPIVPMKEGGGPTSSSSPAGYLPPPWSTTENPLPAELNYFPTPPKINKEGEAEGGIKAGNAFL